MLRRGVWTYVGEERRAGTSPGCVEAYFGHLGGELDDRVAAR
jgi:hypothetical protein